MAAVADLDQELFKKMVELARAYKGVTPIKQTAFTAFVTKSVEEQSKLLTSWEREGFEQFKKEMRITGTKKKICPEENEADDNRDDDETERDGGCSDADHAKQEEIESLKKQMDVLRKKLKDAEEENVQLKEKLKRTEDEVKLVKNTKRKTDASDGNQKKKTSKGEFAVGQKVWALYTDEKSYPAKIIACNGESYKVMFIEDKIQHEVELNGLRPFGKQLD